MIWRSSENYSSIVRKVKTEIPDDCVKAHIAITQDVANRAAYHVGIERDELTGVIDLLE
jgi:hypothetical protein